MIVYTHTHTDTHISFFFRKMSNEYSDNFSISYQEILKWLHTFVLSLIHFSLSVPSKNLFCFLIIIIHIYDLQMKISSSFRVLGIFNPCHYEKSL